MIGGPLKNIISDLSKKKIQVISIASVSGGVEIFSIQKIEYSKDQFDLTDFQSDLNRKEILDKLDVQDPVILVFEGEQVISKLVKKNTNPSDLTFGGKSTDFLSYEFYLNENKGISLVRKAKVTEILEFLEQHNTWCIDFHIGPWVSLHLKQLIDTLTLSNSFYTFQYKGDDLESFYKKDHSLVDAHIKYKLADKTVQSNQLNAIGAFIDFRFPKGNLYDKVELLKKSVNEYKLGKLFRKGLFTSVIVILLLLFTSLILKSQYNKEYVEIQNELYYVQNTYDESLTLKKERDLLAEMTDQLGTIDSNYLSYYVNAIVSQIPEKIGLESIQVNPLGRKISNSKKIEFIRSEILITGKVQNTSLFDEWISILENNDAFNDVQVVDLSIDKQGLSKFKIKISF